MEFRTVRNALPTKLCEYKSRIKVSKNIFVSSDKTSKLYEVSKEVYNNLLNNEITKTYKKALDDKAGIIDEKAKNIAASLGIENKVMKTKQATCYITLKDHKEDFEMSPSVRVINPCNKDIIRVAQICLKSLIRYQT